MKNLPTTEERVWAVLAHLSALALGMGIVLPVIGWSEQRQKSKYASFQCLQALGYQSLGYTVWLLTYLVLVMVLMVAMIALVASAGTNVASANHYLETWGVLFLVLMVGGLGIYFLIPIVAAVFCAMGHDFYYPIMGKRLERYLGYSTTGPSKEQNWLIEDHEDRWVAAMGHFSVIIALWGMLVPLVAWILQGKRSLFLKFQSIQTLAFQAFVNLLWMGAGFLPLFAIFPLVLMSEAAKSDSFTTGNMGGLWVALILILLAFAIILIVPCFHLMGQWAGYRVLKGDDYQYPIVGKLVERWQRSSGAQPLTEQ